MAHVLSLMVGGVTALTMSEANGFIVTTEELGTEEDIVPGTPIDDPEITSSFDMVIKAASSDIRLKVRQVEELLQRAKRRQSVPAGPRIYLRLQVDGETGSTPYRAEITDGRFAPQSPLSQLASGAAKYSLIVTHRAWESTGVAINATSAGNGTPASSNTITLGGNDNWLQIGADQISGSLPGYVQLIITNNSGAAVGFRNWYFGVNAYCPVTNFNHFLEGEARWSGDGTVTASASCSGGNYNAYAFTNTGLIRWDLDQTLVGNQQGRDFLITARPFSYAGTNLQVKPILRDSGGLLALADENAVDWFAPATIPGSQLQLLGSLPFVPGGYSSSWGKAVLELKLKAVGSASYNVDYIHLTPIDSFAHIIQRSYSLPHGDAILFDYGDETHTMLSSDPSFDGQKVFSPRVGRLKLFPGVSQRLTILADEGNSSNVARSLQVAVLVRQRRLTI